MRRLTGPRHSGLLTRLRDDTGSVSILVAILTITGVLLGLGALVVDVGEIFTERRQLQNGADAAALAVAQDCAVGTACTPTAGASTAASYADANAGDGASGVDRVCGNAGTLAGCPAPTGSLYDCEPPPATGTAYVEVRTRTRTAGGSTLLPPTFARTLAGNETYDGASVVACARASWGSPASARTLAMAISLCEWQAATAGGTSYAPPPPYPPNPPVTTERVLRLHGSEAGCTGPSSGQNLPGGFGWIDDTGECELDVDLDSTYSSDPGVSAPGPCAHALQQAAADKSVRYLPVFDEVSGSGTDATYGLRGFAAFVVTGYAMPGGTSVPSWLTGASYCSGSAKCVYGFFTRELVPGDELGGPDLGAARVVMIR
jgi:Putative Flp pilus-assembly TadE/G-like